MVKKISIIFGTRPEAIKLAPVILALRKQPEILSHVCVTAQHREMLDQVLEIFSIIPQSDLNIMRPDQSLAELTARASVGIDSYLRDERPSLVIVQGDTTTTFIATLVAFYHHIPVAHVEAGLRTGNVEAPWPEEANRILTSRLAALHFAPTEINENNLLAEGVPREKIFVTGNTVIDALFLAAEKVKEHPFRIPGISMELVSTWDSSKIVLITGHRRESFGERFKVICQAIARLAKHFTDVQFVYPVHLNPNVRGPVMQILGKDKGLRNVHLLDPLPYLPFVALMERSTLILTDSGGIQEEAPSLGKPVLVLRDTTERPEAVEAGTAKLVGTNSENIIREVSRLLVDPVAYKDMATKKNPYGDGKASERIVKTIMDQFGLGAFI
jgi:UDP-N-acetylglucosamine 2-epimerase (non-hydrolysing)